MIPRSLLGARDLVARAARGWIRLLSGDSEGRPVTKALVPLMMLMLLSFSLACVGLSEPGGQEPVNDSKSRHERWLVDIGGLPEGTVGPPLIVKPEHDATVSGTIEVSGWSVTAKGAGAPADAKVVVHLYVGPTTATKTLGSRKVATVEVDPENGEWKTELSSGDMYLGQTSIGARTEIVDHGTSDITRIMVNSEDGTASEGGQAPTAEESLSLVCVMARTKDSSFSPDDEQKLREIGSHTASYFRDVSNGKLAVADPVWVTGGGKGIEVPDYDTGEYITAVLSNEEVQAKMPEKDAFSVVVFVPKGSDKKASKDGYAAWSASWVSLGVEIDGRAFKPRGSFIHVVEYAGSTVAHEIAHGLGTYRPHSAEDVQLPDMYHLSWFWNGKTDKDYYGVSGYSNLDRWSTANYFVMSSASARETRIPSLGAFSEWWMGWLRWYPSTPSMTTTLVVPNLSRGDLSVDRVPTISVPDEGRRSYVILEGRSLTDEYFTGGQDDSGWAGDGVVVYKIRERTAEETDAVLKEIKKKDSTVVGDAKGWPRSIDYLTTLDGDTPSYVDFGDDYRLELEKGTFNSSAATTRVKTRPVEAMDYVTEWAKRGLVIAGPVMSTSLTGMPLPAIAGGLAAAPDENAVTGVFPDLDLHAYLADGTHVGMNYESGKFENPVEAVVSGDRSMDDEWIMLPPELSEGARYEISSEDAKKYAEASGTEPLTLDYTIRPVMYDEAEMAAAKGPERAEKLKAGESAALTVRSEDDTFTVEPVEDDGDGALPFEFDRARETQAMLAGAALLVVAGIVLLVVPLRRKSEK